MLTDLIFLFLLVFAVGTVWPGIFFSLSLNLFSSTLIMLSSVKSKLF